MPLQKKELCISINDAHRIHAALHSCTPDGAGVPAWWARFAAMNNRILNSLFKEEKAIIASLEEFKDEKEARVKDRRRLWEQKSSGDLPNLTSDGTLFDGVQYSVDVVGTSIKIESELKVLYSDLYHAEDQVTSRLVKFGESEVSVELYLIPAVDLKFSIKAEKASHLVWLGYLMDE